MYSISFQVQDHPDACLLKARTSMLYQLLEDAERHAEFMEQVKNKVVMILILLNSIEKEQKYMQDKYSVSHTLESSINTLIRTTCGSRYEKKYPTGSIRKIQILDPPQCKRWWGRKARTSLLIVYENYLLITIESNSRSSDSILNYFSLLLDHRTYSHFRKQYFKDAFSRCLPLKRRSSLRQKCKIIK